MTIDHFDAEYSKALKQITFKGKRLEITSTMLPGVVAERFSQLQEIESILELLNIKMVKVRQKYYKQYLEGYGRALSSRDAERYADAEDEVIGWRDLINEFALVRNKWHGVMKGLESLQYQVNNVTKLRCAGLDDISF